MEDIRKSVDEDTSTDNKQNIEKFEREMNFR
jgi:hypothetical protein